MTRTLDATQAERALLQHLAPVPLLKITTYSDREAETEGDIFYISDRTVHYDYGNTGTTRTFLPWLRSIGDLRTSIDQVPSPNRTELFSKPLELILANHRWPDVDGEDFISEQLRATYRLENARVELAQVLLDAQPEKLPLDLSGWTGDEHTIFYRGVITRVGPIDATSMRLACDTELPEPELLICDDATENDPRDVGKRWPMPYGSDVLVPLVGRKVPAATTLATAVSASATGTWQVTGDTGFSSSGTFLIGEEQVTYSATGGTTFTVTARGVNGTTAVAHGAGEAIVEVLGSNLVFGVSDVPISAINEVYAEGPNGALTRLTISYAKNTTDETTEAQDTATVEITPANWNTLLGQLAVAARVTQDPSFTNDIVVERTELCDHANAGDDDFATTMVVTDGSGPKYASFPALRSGETFISQRIEIYATAVTGSPGDNFRLAIGTDPSYTDFKSWTIPGNILIGAWDGKTTSYSGNDIKWYWSAGSGVSINIAECRRILRVYAPNPAIDDTTRLAASSGFLPRLWARVDGPYAQVDLDQERTEWQYCEDYMDWSTSGSPTLSDEGTIKTEGTYSLKATETGSSGWGVNYQGTVVDLTDPTHALILIDIRLGWTYAFDRIEVTIGGHASLPSSSHTKTYYFDTTGFDVDAWKTLVIDHLATPDASAGSFDPEQWDYLAIDVNPVVPSSRERTVYLDYIGTIPEVPYSVDVGEVLEAPTDVLYHVLYERGGVAVDLDAMATALANLDDNVLACDLRALGYAWQEQLARLAFESRVNLVPRETADGTVWQMLCAESDYGWPAASGSLSAWESLLEAGRDLAEISSSREARYALNASLGSGEDAFAKVLTDDDATARAAFGVRHVSALVFLAIQDDDTAAEVFGYYRYEDARLAAFFAVNDVPWWVGYALEVGDILEITPEYLSAAKKIRLIEVIKKWSTEQVELRCIEVE